MHISASYSEHDLEILGCIYLCVYIRYLQLAKAEKLKPAEVELKRLEDLAQSLVFDFAYMRSREEQMRDTNGELLCVCVCVCVCVCIHM